MDSVAAREVLAEVDDVGRLTRRAVRSTWMPLLVFGALALIAAALQVLVPGLVGLWWSVTGSAGGVWVWRYYRRRATRLGVCEGRRLYACSWGGMLIGFTVVSVLGPPRLLTVLYWVVVALTYLGIAMAGRRADIGIVGVGVLAAAVGSLSTPNPAAISDLAVGLLLSLTGIGLFVGERGRLMPRRPR